MYAQARQGLPVHGLFVHSAYAQGSAGQVLQAPTPQPPASNTGAFLEKPDISAFPKIETYLQVYDAQGGFVHGLTGEQVVMLEDGQPRPVQALTEIHNGVQMVVAINPGPSFAIRNAKAVSRYDLIKAALRGWANGRMGSTIDDLSLLVTDGPAASHTADPAQWIATLNSGPAEARNASPNLDTLFRAVSLASDPSPRPGMSRVVIFITSPLEGQIDQPLDNLVAQAHDQHIAIDLWLVATSGALSTQSAQQLIALSQGTGGQVFTFTGEETLPSLETYLNPLRSVYQVQYASGASAAGAHTVAARVQAGEGAIESAARAFEVDLQPPEPTFVEPPLEIKRKLPPNSGQKTLLASQPESIAAAAPDDEKQLQVVFDFPDGKMRALTYTALIVDGVLMDENSAPPFDQFSWRLDGYTSSGVHRLQVQARDELGLTGASPELPVQVTVLALEPARAGSFQRSLPILSGLVALIAGAVLMLVLVVGGQLRPRAFRAARRRKKADPVTQPVHIHIEAPAARRSGWANRLQWPGRNAAPKAEAYLNPVPDPENEDTLPPIPITSAEITLGSDTTLAAILLDDASVEGLHARLTCLEDGSYRLADAGSIAGTWINYTPVSLEGMQLEHGDLIHIGRIGFRFTLRKPCQTRKAVIIETGAPAKEAPAEAETGAPEEEEMG